MQLISFLGDSIIEENAHFDENNEVAVLKHLRH